MAALTHSTNSDHFSFSTGNEPQPDSISLEQSHLATLSTEPTTLQLCGDV